MKRLIILLNLSLFACDVPVQPPADPRYEDATFWFDNRSNSPDVEGYNFYIGLATRNYHETVWIGNDTFYVYNNLDGCSTYYFAFTAVDFAGNESVFSDEGIRKTRANPDSCNNAGISDSLFVNNERLQLLGVSEEQRDAWGDFGKQCGEMVARGKLFRIQAGTKGIIEFEAQDIESLKIRFADDSGGNEKLDIYVNGELNQSLLPDQNDDCIYSWEVFFGDPVSGTLQVHADIIGGTNQDWFRINYIILK